MIKHKFKRTGTEWVFDGLVIRLLSSGNRPEIGIERIADGQQSQLPMPQKPGRVTPGERIRRPFPRSHSQRK